MEQLAASTLVDRKTLLIKCIDERGLPALPAGERNDDGETRTSEMFCFFHILIAYNKLWFNCRSQFNLTLISKSLSVDKETVCLLRQLLSRNITKNKR